MPIYMYKCLECTSSSEVLCKSYDVAPKSLTCPKCGVDMIRDMSLETTHFVLKGGCWGLQGYEMSDRHCLEENDKMMKEDDTSARQEESNGN